MDAKEQILSILRGTFRRGMGDMIDFLNHGSDFFTAPASTKYHLAHPGGLAEHSLSAHSTLVRLNETFDMEISSQEINTTALLHDVCKTNFYIEEKRWRKDDRGKWESYIAWGVKDKLPLGHGEKSLFLIGKFLQLTDSEAAAIRWHMGCWTPGIVSDYSSGSAFRAATDKYPLVTLLYMADYMSSQLLEDKQS